MRYSGIWDSLLYAQHVAQADLGQEEAGYSDKTYDLLWQVMVWRGEGRTVFTHLTPLFRVCYTSIALPLPLSPQSMPPPKRCDQGNGTPNDVLL